MIISSGNGQINLVNSQAEVMFGIPREELHGKNIRALVPAWTGVADAASHHFEGEGQRRDGTGFRSR